MLGTAVGCCELGGQEMAAEVVPLSQSRRQRPCVCLQSSTLPLQVMVGAAPTLQREWDHSRSPVIDKAPVTPQGSVSLPPSPPTLTQGPLGTQDVCQGCHRIPCRSYKCVFIYTLTVARTATLI